MSIQNTSVQGTLIEGLNEKTLKAKLNLIDAKPFLFGTHFPVAKVDNYLWKMLTNVNRGHNIAGDITSDNSSIVRKSRPIFQTASGDLPRIAISRQMERSDIKQYQVALALAGDPQATELVKYWADDVEFCFNGVQSELEYIAWQLASNAGKFKVTGANNYGPASEFDTDYQVDEEQKLKNSVSFGNSATADVIGDFQKAVKAGKDRGCNIKYAFTSLENFYRIATADQIIKSCSSYLANAVGAAQTPDLASVNAMLAKSAWLNGIQLIVIDQTISRELADGTITSANPFNDNVIVFSEKNILGSTQYDILDDANPYVLKATRTHTTVKKYSVSEPLTEVTMGEADAVPVLDTAYRNIYMKTNAIAW